MDTAAHNSSPKGSNTTVSGLHEKQVCMQFIDIHAGKTIYRNKYILKKVLDAQNY